MLHRQNLKTPFNRLLVLLLSLLVSFAAGLSTAKAQTWKKIGTLDGYISLVKFLDANTGFVGVGVPPGKPVTGPSPLELQKTTDGGKTWFKVSIPTGYGGAIADLNMVDSLNGWIAMAVWGGSGNKALWRTTDAGMTWNETGLAGCGNTVRITPSAIVVTDVLGNFHISTDGAKTFSSGAMNSTNGLDFVDALHGVISVFHGSNWLITSDGGLTWQNLSMNIESWSIYADTGTPNFYAAPEGPTNGSARHAIIYHSTDYGNTWGQLANFPFISTGHLAAIGDKYLFFQVQDVDTTIAGVSYRGFYYSTDQGVTWTGIDGPSAFGDTRFSVVNGCSGIHLFGFDDQSPGTVYEYSFSSGPTDRPVLNLPVIPRLTQSSCAPMDTSIELDVSGCIPSSATIDSLWFSGSSAFSFTNMRSTPSTLAAVDSILISYASAGGPDTAYLHIRYDLGSGRRDTSIALIGAINSALLAQPAQLHREAASAYFGEVDSLELGVDLGAQVNLDSLWPYLNDIQGTFAFDSSIVSFESYTPPAGWTITSLLNRGNAVDFGIHKVSGQATQPLDLGTARFLPNTTQLATSWVTLPRFVLDIGKQAVSLCVTDNEDSHWAVKTLGAESGVAPQSAPTTRESTTQDEISIYPNPAENEFFVRNTNAHSARITVYDAIGRTVASANISAATTGTIDIAQLARGSYVVVCQVGDHMVVRRLDKAR